MIRPVNAEEALVRRCAAGDPEAWRQFVDHYAGWVLRVARVALKRMTGTASEADAEDACAEVFRQLVERDRAMLRSLRPPFHLEAWLAVVTRRACGKLLRRKPLPPSAREPAVPPSEPSPWIDLLARLPAEDRVLLELFFVHDASYEEIGAALGMSAESIGKAKFRALERLRVLAKESGLEGPT
jgi:RNA polymerase sigma-70 factor (ECF subfamily)